MHDVVAVLERDDFEPVTSDPPAPPRAPKRAANVVGLLGAAATFAFLLPGAGRGYDMDSGLTVDLFVATRSIWDSFDRFYLFTNQVLFSFFDHLVFTATGSRSEMVLRLFPIAMTAFAVGLLAKVLTERLGVGPGVAGAAVLLTNPLFAMEGSAVRGYSLVVSCALVTTLLFLRALDADEMSTPAKIAYAIVGAIGVATHLYMIVVLAIHGVMSLCSRRQLERMVIPIAASLLGIAAYIRIARPMHTVAQITGRSFQPAFPRDLAVELLGGGLVATVIAVVLVAPAAWNARRSRVVQLGAAAVVAAVMAAWLVAPQFLYPRFFLWLTPMVAVGVAISVAKRRTMAVVVVALVAVQVVTVWPRITISDYPTQPAAHVFAAVAERGGTPCAVGVYTGLRMLGSFDGSLWLLPSPARPGPCTVAFRIGIPTVDVQRIFDRSFPYHVRFDAREPGMLWSKLPLSCWTSKHAPSSGCTPTR